MELKYREAEAEDALEMVRQCLRLRTMMNCFRISHIGGQGVLTRTQGVYQSIHIRLHLAKVRYRYTRNALLRLRGHGGWEEQLQVLQDDDLRALNECSLNKKEQVEEERLRVLGVAAVNGIAQLGVVTQGEGSKTLSWIWYSSLKGRDEAESDPEVQDGMSFFIDCFYWTELM
jgi:hypothetical protein